MSATAAAWCPHCRRESSIDAHGHCMHIDCDAIVLDGKPLVLPVRTSNVGRGRGSDHITASVLREAYELYLTGLSLRAVAEVIWPRTSYANARSCANSMHNQWRALGWQLRSKSAVTIARNWKHGKLRRDAKDPAFRGEQRRASGEIRALQCKAILTRYGKGRGRQCKRWAMLESEFCHNHDPSRSAERHAHLETARARRQ